MASALPTSLLMMLVFTAILVVTASLLHVFLVWRSRLRWVRRARLLPGPQGSPAGTDVR